MKQREVAKIRDSISVLSFYEKHKKTLLLEMLAGETGLDNRIHETSLNRPALALTGYFKHFAARRIQLFGAGEVAYLQDLPEPEQYKVLNLMADKGIPCIIVSRNQDVTGPLLKVCDQRNVPLLRTTNKSKHFMTEATIRLEDLFAPRTTVHGTVMDVKGIGTLLRGKSGVGKSECALALIERGHSIVADDHAYIRLVRETELMASSSELNRGYMECRGIGIINITELFGIRSIRVEKRIDLVVTFIEWQPGMQEERTGLEQNYYPILGKKVAHIEIPVRPGRDIARLVEVASMVQAQRQIGHDSAQEFNQRLIEHMSINA